MTSQSAVAQSSLDLSSTSTDYFKQSPLILDNENPEEPYTISTRSKNNQQLAEAEQLNQQAITLREQGKYIEAIPLVQRSLAIRESVLGPNHLGVGISLNNLATLYKEIGNYTEALPRYQRALIILETALGPNHPDFATSLGSLAELYQLQGNYTEALASYQRALAIREAVLGAGHPSVASSLNNIGTLHEAQGNYAEAFPYHQRALEIREAALGANHPYVAISLHNIAALYQAQGNYAEALAQYQRGLAISETALGPDHPYVANSLNSIGGIYKAQGNYAEALTQYQQALAIRESTLGPDHPDVAQSINNIALVYEAQGNYAEALTRLQRSLKIREATLEPNHPYIANNLHDIAFVYEAQGKYAEALSRYHRALEMLEATLGPNHPDIAVSLNNIALLYEVQGDYAEALPRHQRALEISETALGPGHPNVANNLNSLATFYLSQDNYAEALPRYQRALAIFEATLDPNHPYIANNLNNLAVLYQTQGNQEQATIYLQRAAKIEEANLSNFLISGSESERQLYLNTFRGTTNTMVSLGIQSRDSSARELAMSTLLRRKGRVLDSVTGSLQKLRQQLSTEEKNLLDEFNSSRSALAALYFNGLENYSPEQYQAEINRLKEKVKSLETSLSQRSEEFRIETQSASIESVQALIPNHAALVELVRYEPFNFEDYQNRWSEPERYAAYILTANGQLQAIDLGEAAPIDALVAEFRRALGSQSSRTKTIARQLDEQIMAPIRPLLGDNTHLLLSPDSQLNLIPFAALVTEDDHYLLEDYQLTYLTSGRDLLRLQLDQPSQQGPVVLANPDYKNPGSNEVIQLAQASRGNGGVGESESQRSVDITNLAFGPLPGTAEEAEVIAPLLDNATVLTQTNATENALKQLNAPSILHIATHGFFLEDVDFFVPPDSRGLRAGIEIISNDNARPIQPTPSNTENPLLRSGLALAGFNQRSSGTEDGVLTALEASGLNLYGTKLVVLSACDTGVGQVSTGEGVYGLRRAFVTAGAESQLMSLWQVSDYGTTALMELYYQNLKADQSRSEALHNAQITLMKSGQYQHPYYWASFIFSGNWSPLEGI